MSNPVITITGAYGRKIQLTEAQIAEWMDDLPQAIDEIMIQPLSVGDDNASSFSPFAFCAPEVIRGKIAAHILTVKVEEASGQ